MPAALDGPRLPPRAQGPARQLVVFLHGYGADGNDLIEIGRAWQPLLPQAAFVSPHAPEPCRISAYGIRANPQKGLLSPPTRLHCNVGRTWALECRSEKNDR